MLSFSFNCYVFVCSFFCTSTFGFGVVMELLLTYFIIVIVGCFYHEIVMCMLLAKGKECVFSLGQVCILVYFCVSVIFWFFVLFVALNWFHFLLKVMYVPFPFETLFWSELFTISGFYSFISENISANIFFILWKSRFVCFEIFYSSINSISPTV